MGGKKHRNFRRPKYEIMRHSRHEFNFSVVIWLPLLPLLIICIGDYFRKKTSSKKDVCWESLNNNVSVSREAVDWVSAEISHLRRLFDLIESTSIRTNKKDQITNVDRIGISHETLRRRVLNYFHEARYTLNNLRNIFTQLKKVNQKELDTETVSSIQASLVRYRQNMEETISHLQLILNKLGELDEFSHMRKNGLNKLSQRLQEKIQKQQNPSDCKKAKYMTFDFTNLCGLGCCMHQLMYCLQLALENERVLVLKKHYPGDIFREWLHQNMLPLSDKCSYLDSDGRSDNINCPWIVKAPQVHNWLPHVLPIDMNKELLRLHEAPFVWFAGQLAAYILRPKPQFAQLINVTLKSFKTSGDPVVGVHIRRTDKLIWEAQFHNLSEYMEHVNNFFDLQSVNLLTMSKRHIWIIAFDPQVSERIIRRNNSVQAKRSVYLSTDDPNIFTQLPYSYPNYTVYGSRGRSHSANLNMRMSVNSMNNAIIDIIALSMTDFLVCTFSSNVCRLAYELMQTRHMDLGDATQLFHSIDKLYHEEDYGRLKFNVIIPDMKVNLKYGDVVEIVKTYWNGSLLVKLVQSSEDIHNKNQKGMKNDLFIAPAYKLRPIINMTGFN
ncbi:Alpha-(1,6)-fucosyltransferase [Schistosoma haematobium]|uniref:Alpha-(1,6)-fucosyltransferase n=1 Tax=Schistosoma haematobium TaxID=6185 RepID=A0A922ISR0_SCHHA|nr:Alpha-(1,6)-fucosyltransferase [Schistosoma haematobium]KAH9586801.1 Alpha-(1,6)-fucosyltransferase [Schistosoma haematobium]